MPLAKLKPVLIEEELPVRGRAPASTMDGMATASPARLLQHRLEMQVARDPARWPLGRAVAFMVMASAALWMALLVAATELVHAIA